jgi:uncharacterized membrane protein required for colicin V production
MGLDIVLGGIILFLAFRGWFKGFIRQAVSLASLILAVYAAVPVREYVKPHVIPFLAAIQSDIIDRLLWWVSAVLTYLILAAVATTIVKMTRRPMIPGISQSDRNDQFAGFLFGASKGLLIAAFMAALIQNFGLEHAKNVNWVEDQAKASWALKWNEAYQPGDKIWASKPMQHVWNQINRMGIREPGDPLEKSSDVAENESVVRTASRPTEAEGTAGPDRSSKPATPAGSSASSVAPPAEAPPSPTE